MGTGPDIVPPAFGGVIHDRPRVLVEASEWARAASVADGLQSQGIEAVTCAGPEGHDLRCPFVGGRGCAPVDAADVMVFLLRLTDVRNLELLSRLRADRPDLPIVVAVPPPLVERNAAVLDGTSVVGWSATTADIVSAVMSALEEQFGILEVDQPGAASTLRVIATPPEKLSGPLG